MNILAVDTTGKLAQIVCTKNDEIFKSELTGPFSEKILPAIDQVLKDANVDINNIDCFAVATGPGSFTGIRIGIAVIKGFLSAKKTNCIAVNSFEQIAYNIKDNDFIVLLDSGNIEHYYAIFKDKKVTEMGHGTMEKIKSFANQSGLKIYYSKKEKDAFCDFDNLNMVEENENSFANLIKDKAKNGEFVSISQISPIYIKLSQAEIGLEQNMKLHTKYRIAEKLDAEALSIIDEQCFDGTERYDKNSFDAELNEDSKHYFVATYDNLVIGYVGLQVLGNDLNLVKIAVLPQYRQLGVGFQLMQMASDFRKENNLEKYFLEVRENNKKAIKLYQKFGFKTSNVRDKYYGDGENALVMFAK